MDKWQEPKDEQELVLLLFHSEAQHYAYPSNGSQIITMYHKLWHKHVEACKCKSSGVEKIALPFQM